MGCSSKTEEPAPPYTSSISDLRAARGRIQITSMRPLCVVQAKEMKLGNLFGQF
jgi:hypothetical protein